MTTIAEVREQRDVLVEVLRELLVAVLTKKQNSSGQAKADWEDAENQVKNLISELNAAAFEIALNLAQPALDDLKKITKELETEAGRMRSATEFIDRLNEILGAATTLMDVIKRD